MLIILLFQKLTAEELKLCDELFAVICPSMESVTSTEWRDKLESSAQRAFSLLTGSQKTLIGDSDGELFPIFVLYSLRSCRSLSKILGSLVLRELLLDLSANARI